MLEIRGHGPLGYAYESNENYKHAHLYLFLLQLNAALKREFRFIHKILC